MALKAAESNVQRQIEQAQKNKNITFSVMMQPQRKNHWVRLLLFLKLIPNNDCAPMHSNIEYRVFLLLFIWNTPILFHFLYFIQISYYFFFSPSVPHTTV